MCTFNNYTFENCENINIIDVRQFKIEKFLSYYVKLIDIDRITGFDNDIDAKYKDFNKYCDDYIIKAIDFIKTIFIEE